MKLRIKGDSIRLRLTRDELSRFAGTNRVEEILHFPGGRRLHYALEASDDVDHLTARLANDVLTLMMPVSWLKTWSDTDRVGFEAVEPLESGGQLHLLVEKDFECLHKRPDDENAFPHPMANEA